MSLFPYSKEGVLQGGHQFREESLLCMIQFISSHSFFLGNSVVLRIPFNGLGMQGHSSNGMRLNAIEQVITPLCRSSDKVDYLNLVV